MVQKLEGDAQIFRVNGLLKEADEIDALVLKYREKGIPEHFPSSVAPETPQHRGLEPIRFKIEIPTVSAKVYAETRQAVEAAIPDVFISPIRSVPIGDLLREDEQRGQRRLGYVNESRTMRATTPPEMEVFIDPNNFKIDGSNRLSTDVQKARIAEEAAKIRERLPENVRGFVVWRMMDPSTVSQAEDRYMDTHDGELLMPDFFIRTDVQTAPGNVVVDWDRYVDGDVVFAGLVGVLPQKSAV